MLDEERVHVLHLSQLLRHEVPKDEVLEPPLVEEVHAARGVARDLDHRDALKEEGLVTTRQGLEVVVVVPLVLGGADQQNAVGVPLSLTTPDRGDPTVPGEGLHVPLDVPHERERQGPGSATVPVAVRLPVGVRSAGDPRVRVDVDAIVDSRVETRDVLRGVASSRGQDLTGDLLLKVREGLLELVLQERPDEPDTLGHGLREARDLDEDLVQAPLELGSRVALHPRGAESIDLPVRTRAVVPGDMHAPVQALSRRSPYGEAAESHRVALQDLRENGVEDLVDQRGDTVDLDGHVLILPPPRGGD